MTISKSAISGASSLPRTLIAFLIDASIVLMATLGAVFLPFLQWVAASPDTRSVPPLLYFLIYSPILVAGAIPFMAVGYWALCRHVLGTTAGRFALMIPSASGLIPGRHAHAVRWLIWIVFASLLTAFLLGVLRGGWPALTLAVFIRG